MLFSCYDFAVDPGIFLMTFVKVPNSLSTLENALLAFGAREGIVSFS